MLPRVCTTIWQSDAPCRPLGGSYAPVFTYMYNVCMYYVFLDMVFNMFGAKLPPLISYFWLYGIHFTVEHCCDPSHSVQIMEVSRFQGLFDMRGCGLPV